MNFAVSIVVFLLLIVLGYVLSTFLLLLVRQYMSPLRNLRGPASPSFFMGNLREMHDQENNDLIARWERQHGSTFIYHGFLGGCRLMTTDPFAVAHILGRGYDYPKPDFVRENLASMTAGKEGLLSVEGEVHRRQRKVINPAFTSSRIKSLSPIFWREAIQLRDVWIQIISSSSSQPETHVSLINPIDPFDLHVDTTQLEDAENESISFSTAKSTSLLSNPFSSFVPGKRTTRRAPNRALLNTSNQKVDVMSWLARATLDVIGEAGFGYAFNSLEAAAMGKPDESELARAFRLVFTSARKFRMITILQAWFPVLFVFRKNSAAMKEAHECMRRIGLSLIEERQAAFSAEKYKTLHPNKPEADVQGDSAPECRDLLSVLVRSNLASDPTQRLSLNETLCQISTFLSAGHETTTSALTWTLYALARASDVQTRLREELLAIPTGDMAKPSHALFDAVLRHEYLEQVIREALRVHAPITSTMRVAGNDDVIPVMRPFQDRHGRMCNRIYVKKGDIITIPIQAINKNKEVWGDDAAKFRPDRWAEQPWADDKNEGLESGHRRDIFPGLWGNILTFLNGNPINGNRACIGFRFAINEMKIFLFVLLRDIEFSIDPSVEIEKKLNVVTRPCVKSEPHVGNQMPLILRAIRQPRGPLISSP